MLKLHTIVCSTRPGRVGLSVGRWFHAAAQGHGGFEAELVDLADFALPVYDEPHHPRLQRYEQAHTRAWAASVAAADAYVFVTPEYNYGPPPSFVNALTYVYREWNHKAAGFVSYGGVSGGMRAVQAERLMLTSLKVMPMAEQVSIPMVGQQIDGEGVFTPTEGQGKGAAAMLTELARWAGALKPLRAEA